MVAKWTGAFLPQRRQDDGGGCVTQSAFQVATPRVLFQGPYEPPIPFRPTMMLAPMASAS